MSTGDKENKQLNLTSPEAKKGLANRRQRGFTVAEIMVAMGVFGILTASAVGSLGNLAPSFNLDSAAHITTMALNQARVQAITRGHNMVVTFGPNSFTITDEVNDKTVATGQLPPHITVSTANTPTFTPLGTAATPLTVTVSNGSNSRNVSVGLTGEVQLQ
jgi:prepilin-type N-terminal cleavage/methylation domain-containing protein